MHVTRMTPIRENSCTHDREFGDQSDFSTLPFKDT